MIRVGDIEGLDQETGSDDLVALFVELDVEREGVGWEEPDVLQVLDESLLRVQRDVQVVVVSLCVGDEGPQPGLSVERGGYVRGVLQLLRKVFDLVLYDRVGVVQVARNDHL